MHTMKKFIRYYAPYKAVFFLDLICAAVISLVDLAFSADIADTYKDLVRRTGRPYITGPSPNRSGASCNLYFTGAV